MEKLEKTKQIIYDILIDFDVICKSNNLTYYISYGTLLGAIRNGGFIPWDDDIDVVMPREDYKPIGLIGLGNVTKATMDIFLAHTKHKKLIIKLYRHKDQAEMLIKRYENYTNVEFVICESYEETIMDSDIIVSGITYAEKDFCDDKYFKEGCLVVPIHTLGFQNCDLFFDKVYGDDYSHICGFKFFNEFKSFNEVSEVINNLAKGRENDKERILVYNIGIAIHDVYYSHKIYEKTL